MTTGSPEGGGAPGPSASAANGAPAAEPEPGDGSTRRPLVERLGMAAVALVIAVLFGAMAVAAWVGGEAFLAAMAALGALMTAWAGAVTLFRG